MRPRSPRFALLALLALPFTLRADVEMPALFGDHMVLQQDAKLPVWGWASAGEEVTVTFGKQTAKAKAGEDGKWSIKLDPVPANSAPHTLTVAGKNLLKFEDVLVGDVWICAGQSNMELGVGLSTGGKEAVASADFPAIRLFSVPKGLSFDPRERFVPLEAGSPQPKWEVCSPATLGVGVWEGFSAVGFYFGREIHVTTGNPVGLIASHWGGTPAQAWTSQEGLAKKPPFRKYLLKAAVKEWQTGANINAPAPTTLYNAMISPLIPYAIKGVIWYQGEGNEYRPAEYAALFPRLILDWREKWGQGEFPFLFSQLANYRALQKMPGEESSWAVLREGQRSTLSLPHTGMSVSIDIGDADDIHPRNKLDVGLRLAEAAKHVAYGQDNVWSGPVYESVKFEGDRAVLSFTSIGGGMQIGRDGVSSKNELTGFVIAGKDKKWRWAKAVIEGDKIVVSSEEVKAPVAVRYGWADNPVCNLYNKENLPASPFRTDDWPLK